MKIQVEKPKGEKVASIDLGVNTLATVIINDGTALFYRGSLVKSDYFYFQERIAELDKLKSEAEKVDELNAREEVLRERVLTRLYRRLLHYYRTLASHLLFRRGRRESSLLSYCSSLGKRHKRKLFFMLKPYPAWRGLSSYLSLYHLSLYPFLS
ncbi:MAG: transposase [Candidatus Aramenus sp.]|nr:transposase [Candidatus Aramenus sp.]